MKFQVFQEGKVVDKFDLSGAYLFGTDGIAIRKAQIRFKNGFIECSKPNMETAGLVLLWPIKGFGKILLPTTCLPERTEPYNLNVELARAKLMQIINKREDWSYFNVEALGDISKEAHNLFIQALQNIADMPSASKLADAALEKALFFSEKLATEQADTLFKLRRKNRGFGRGCLGCRVNPAQIDNPDYLKYLLDLFGFVTVPVNWALTEPVKGEYDFTILDECINLLSKKKVTIGAGPLVCFSKEYLPKWILQGKGGFEKIRESAYQFVSEIVNRYGTSVRTWFTISGLNALNYFSFNFEQVLEMTRAVNMAVKAANESARKVIEVCHPWGEYYAFSAGTIPPVVYMDMVVQSGINFDAFGLQMRFDVNKSDIYIRDMMQISAILDYLTPISKPFYITDVAFPSQLADKNSDKESQSWDQSRQRQWLEQFYKIAFSKPFVDSITYSSLADTKDNPMINSGLLTEQLKPKQAYGSLKKLQELIFNR